MNKYMYIALDLELRRVGSISFAIVRDAIVPFFFPARVFVK